MIGQPCIPYIGNGGGNIGPPGPSGSNSQTYYFSSNPANVGGYESALRNPGLNPQDDDSVSVSNGTGEVLIDSYVTIQDDPGVLEIPAGVWSFKMFHYVDNALGVSWFRYKVFKRSVAGAETLLFTVNTNEVNALSVAEINIDYTVTTAIPLLADDRIVIKVYAVTTSVSTRIAHFVYEGNLNVSRVVTTIDVNTPRGLVRTTDTVTTTDATLTPIAIIPIPDNTCMYIDARIVGRRTDTADRAAYLRRVCVYREAGAAPVFQGAIATVFTRESATGWQASFQINGNNVEIVVAGNVGQTVNWRSEYYSPLEVT